MKKYKIQLKQGFYGIIRARDESELRKKLSTGSYGVLSRRGRQITRYTPENISEIIEMEEGLSN